MWRADDRLKLVIMVLFVGWALFGCDDDYRRYAFADATVVSARDAGFDSSTGAGAGGGAGRDAAQEAGAEPGAFADASRIGDAEPAAQTDSSLIMDDAGDEQGTTCHDQIGRGATQLAGSAAAIQDGIEFFSTQPIPVEAYLVLDYFHRAFGVDPFADALDTYDERLRAGTGEDGYFRVLRRIADPENTYETGDWSTIMGVDSITMPALYCRDQPLPESYPGDLIAARDAGEYELTHVGLALIFLENNGCSVSLDADFRPDVESRIAAIPDRADGLADLEMEAIAFLLQLRRADLVDLDDLRLLVSSALPSGGWGSTPASTTADWHTTTLGLWSLFLFECPEVLEPLAAQS